MNGQEPGPGFYNVAKSHTVSQGQRTPGEPRTEMGRKRRRAFLVYSERFRARTVPGGTKIDTDIPGTEASDST